MKRTKLTIQSGAWVKVSSHWWRNSSISVGFLLIWMFPELTVEEMRGLCIRSLQK